MAKSSPFSMRLSERSDALVSEEARRTRRSKGAVVEALAEEALRARLFAGSPSAAPTGIAGRG